MAASSKDAAKDNIRSLNISAGRLPIAVNPAMTPFKTPSDRSRNATPSCGGEKRAASLKAPPPPANAPIARAPHRDPEVHQAEDKRDKPDSPQWHTGDGTKDEPPAGCADEAAADADHGGCDHDRPARLGGGLPDNT